MSILPPDEINPYRAPVATIGQASGVGLNPDAEVIRRTYLSHEASVKGIGALAYLGAFGLVLGTIGLIIGATQAPAPQTADGQTISTLPLILGMAVLFGFLSLLYGAIGYGLRRLQPWARWTMVVLIGLTFLVNLIQVIAATVANPALGAVTLGGAVVGGLIPGYILYLMLSAKGSMVFSREYKDIIRITPHIKYRMSLIVKVLLGLLVGLILLAVIGALLSSMNSR